jgi:hypothetical protein
MMMEVRSKMDQLLYLRCASLLLLFGIAHDMMYERLDETYSEIAGY